MKMRRVNKVEFKKIKSAFTFAPSQIKASYVDQWCRMAVFKWLNESGELLFQVQCEQKRPTEGLNGYESGYFVRADLVL